MDYFAAVKKLKEDGVIHPLYLLNGPEHYLKEEFVQELLNYIKEQTGKQYFLERLDGRRISLADLLFDAKQATLFPGGRLLWVSDPLYFSASKKKEGAAPKKEKSPVPPRTASRPSGEKELLSFLQGGNDPVIVFSVQDVDRRRKLVKAIEGAGMLINFVQLRGAPLRRWLKEQFLREKKKAEEKALNELIERVGDNLYLLKREVEKIATYMADDKVVTHLLVRQMVPESSLGNIFNLVEAIGQKDTGEAFFHLYKLFQQNEHPLVIMAMINRQFRLLYQLRILQEKELPRREVTAFLKVQPFVVKKLEQQAQKYSIPAIAGIIAHLHETDWKIKTGRLEANEALEQLILALTVSSGALY